MRKHAKNVAGEIFIPIYAQFIPGLFMKSFHLHLVSDSTGETVSSVSRAALVQFEDVEPEEHIWTLVRTKGQLEKVLAGIDAHPGVVMFTLVSRELRRTLRQHCDAKRIPCIPVLGPVIKEFEQYLGKEGSRNPGKQHELTEDYFSRVEAINYALAHDDGQATWELDDADVVLVGVSRTSKSPTCVYLAYRGFKAANVPFVLDCPLPDNLEQLKNPLIVGLTIGTDRLMQIRKTRLQSLKEEKEPNYIDIELVEKEIAESRKLYRKHGWPVIDVTRRSVEETAATIIQLLTKRREKAMQSEEQQEQQA